MILRPFFFEETSCASYLFGCTTHGKLAVVEPHEALVDRYFAEAERIGSPIVAVFETHIQADHVSGLAELVARTGANAYLPAGAAVEFEHCDLRNGELAHQLHASLQRLLALPDGVTVYPSHYGGSVCGRGLSANPVSTIGFERRHNQALQHDGADSFAAALLEDVPPPPAGQEAIVAANTRGGSLAPA